MTDPKKNHKENSNAQQEKPAGSEPAAVSAGEYEALKAKVAELEALKDKFIRSAADFENAKKRNAREKEEFMKFSQERILRDLLPVLDNFERALSHASEVLNGSPGDESVRKNYQNFVAGIQMVQKQFFDTLKAHGLVKLETGNQRFDPHRHEVIAYVSEAGTEDEIVDEQSAGYMLHDRLLRAAKVRVRVPPQSRNLSGEKQDEIT